MAEKHDAECLRRQAESGWQYICTCKVQITALQSRGNDGR